MTVPTLVIAFDALLRPALIFAAAWLIAVWALRQDDRVSRLIDKLTKPCMKRRE